MSDHTPAGATALYGTMDGERDLEGKEDAKGQASPPLGLMGLTVIMFFNVSGGPFVSETVVGQAGPLFAILGIILALLFYAVPSALLTSELATAYPEDAGIVSWVTAAFGPKLGFMQGFLWWLYQVFSIAGYPLLLRDYLVYAVCPSVTSFTSLQAAYCAPLDDHLLPLLPTNGTLVMAAFVLVITWLNWRGLKVVGSVTILLIIFVLIPFVVMSIAGVAQHFNPSVWTRDRPFGADQAGAHLPIKWFPFVSAVVWCLNSWDSASTLAGEVEKPEKTIPASLFHCIWLSGATYLIPILACTAALPAQTWAAGFWVQAGLEIGGPVLQCWIFASAVVSFSGQFLACQASIVYELYGMAELGQLPMGFLRRNSSGVPIWSLMLSAFVVGLALIACGGHLEVIIPMSNSVYSLSQLLNYTVFLWLRWKHPTVHRPFRIPFGLVGCSLLLLPPACISVYLVSAPFFIGWWVVEGAVAFALAAGVLLQVVLSLTRCHFPDSFRSERQSQSEGDSEGLHVSLKESSH